MFAQPVQLPENLTGTDLVVAKESWNIGLSVFNGLNLDTRYEYLLNSIPLLIQEEITGLPEHRLSDEEKSHFRTLHIEAKKVALEKSKSAVHSQRDALLFSDLDTEDRRNKYKTFTQDIDDKSKLIDFWNQLDEDQIEIKNSLPVALQSYSDSVASLLVPRVQQQRFMESENLDLLISGTVERLDNLFYLNIEALVQHSSEPVFSMGKIVSEQEINETVRDEVIKLRSVILGRSWSDLTVHVLPSNALIQIDGETKGVGSVQIPHQEPGFITLSVLSNGYISDIRQIYLISGEQKVIDIELVAGQNTYLSLISDPPGADVYIGATWVGSTPIQIEKPGEQSLITIRKDKHMSFYQNSDDIKGDSLTVHLASDILNRQKELELSKKKFYRSLGWFSLSVAVPLILSGVYENLDNRYYVYALDYNSTLNPDSYDKALEYYDKASIAYYSMWGGIAVSSGLLVNTLFKLRDYIRAAEYATED
ncbi:MAG: PEGA domain-containing protein [Spirochaetales bacterium]|nr:PEGA domain-containing protein [Spirochaetales bacterium]